MWLVAISLDASDVLETKLLSFHEIFKINGQFKN